MKLDMHFEGDLQASLDRLEAGMKEHVVRSAARAGALVFYEEARLRAPVYAGSPRKGVKPGQLRDAIYHAFADDKSGEAVKIYRISWNPKKAPHAHLIEYGHWIVQRVNGQKVRKGRVPAIPFIRGSFDRANDAMRAMQERAAERTAELLAGGVMS